MGAPGQTTIADAVGVKFDTYENSFQQFRRNSPYYPASFPEQPYDFSQFFADGDNETTLSQNANPSNLHAIGFATDGSWHDLIVTWDTATQTVLYA